jgi:hypothetical protein
MEIQLSLLILLKEINLGNVKYVMKFITKKLFFVTNARYLGLWKCFKI